MSTRVYRTLLLLYPSSFRRAYGDDMVAVFEDMQRDRSVPALWWRVLIDGFTSITVQRLESLMSKRSNIVPLTFATAAALVLVVAALRGVENMAAFLITLVLAGAAVAAALVYWQANRAYTEPAEHLHHYWWRPLLAGGALVGVANVGAALDYEVAWLVLFSSIIAGIMLIAVGVILSVIHVVHLVRRRGVLGVE